MKSTVLSLSVAFLLACAQQSERPNHLIEPILGARVSPEIAYPEKPPVKLCDQIKIDCSSSFTAGKVASNGDQYFLIVRLHGIFLDDGDDLADGSMVDNGLIVKSNNGNYLLISNDVSSLDISEDTQEINVSTAIQLYQSVFENMKRNLPHNFLQKAIEKSPNCSATMREALKRSELYVCVP
jgi:hypothetical protein